MNWLKRLLPSIGHSNDERSSVPEGLWRQCPRCEAVLYRPELENLLEVCPKCGHHIRIDARHRLDYFLDPGERTELATEIEPHDWLKFRDTRRYRERLASAQKATGEKEALVVMRGTLEGIHLVVVAFEFRFLGGSMGGAVGAKFVAATDHCLEHHLPLVCFATSGGARMQESMISLLQMAKTSAALERMKQLGIPYISVMVDPVYGGVSASLAMLGDINIAEPSALVGFTGPRVIEQTVRVKLPEGFQRSEFLLSHGAIDMIVYRADMRRRISGLLRKLLRQVEPA